MAGEIKILTHGGITCGYKKGVTFSATTAARPACDAALQGLDACAFRSSEPSPVLAPCALVHRSLRSKDSAIFALCAAEEAANYPRTQTGTSNPCPVETARSGKRAIDISQPGPKYPAQAFGPVSMFADQCDGTPPPLHPVATHHRLYSR